MNIRFAWLRLTDWVVNDIELILLHSFDLCINHYFSLLFLMNENEWGEKISFEERNCIFT